MGKFSWSNKDFEAAVFVNPQTLRDRGGHPGAEFQWTKPSPNKMMESSLWMLPVICETWACLWDEVGLREQFEDAFFRLGYFNMVEDSEEAYLCWVSGDYAANVLQRPLYNYLVQCFTGTNGQLIASCLMYCKRVYAPTGGMDPSATALKKWKERNTFEKRINLHQDFMVEDRWLTVPEYSRDLEDYNRSSFHSIYTRSSKLWAQDHLTLGGRYPYARIGHKHICDSIKATARDVMPESDVRKIWKRLESVFEGKYVPHFPSGSTADCGRNLVRQMSMLFATCGAEAIKGYPSDNVGFFRTERSFKEDYLDALERSNPRMRIIDVPKSGDSRRIIGPVSAVSNILTHELQVILYDYKPRYKYVNFDLRDQSINRDMAREGSVFGTYATTDLTAASDSISRKALELTTPEYQHDLLISPVPNKGTIQATKEKVHVQSVGISGATTTYFIESFYIGNILEYVCGFYVDFVADTHERKEIREHLKKGGFLASVRGDDIVIITCLADFVTEILTDLGQTVNTKKSYSEGNFRESCGGNYISGIDVTPVYFPRRPVEATAVEGTAKFREDDYTSFWEPNGNVSVTTSLATVVSAHNALYQWPKAQQALYWFIKCNAVRFLTSSCDTEETGLKTTDESLWCKEYTSKPYSDDAYKVKSETVWVKEVRLGGIRLKGEEVEILPPTILDKPKNILKPNYAEPKLVGKTLKHRVGTSTLGSVGKKIFVDDYETYTVTKDDFYERKYMGPVDEMEMHRAGHDPFRDTLLYVTYLAEGPQYADPLMELLKVSIPRTCK